MPLAHVSRTPFDANGHPEAAVDAVGRETRAVFDRRGNLTLHLDAAGTRPASITAKR
ncbi:RHS repeat domain-containing protein [Acidovorax sp. PRC11]|uniref:RHS repeat domain-containing protein n=1 Tax=Acidovorax sp. PRC11 TaxID=2962592 RepID=UPI002880C9AA|nr:RHS repeat domain-containing protein [Acidovorax sp. PRC11]MDT0137216.1 RHS repeat domain-containing protein [Acidovorax sp. PRC11]